jgi:RNA polymerase sigma-70 factor (ECF subfamily)
LAGLTDGQLLERFTRRRDEAAFRALVDRHGPMVLDVCRRVLRDPHAAEDAFQATFLVLARKSGTLARPELLGNWLYGVAYRLALKAKTGTARRAAHERQAATMATRADDIGPPSDPHLALAWREVQVILDEELSRLPEKPRAAVVLCYLEGKTHEEAARQIGCPVGSMSTLVAQARELLRRRLTRRGLTFSAGVLALLLAQSSAAAVPPVLADATVKAGLAALAGRWTASGAGVLARSLVSEMTAPRRQWAAALALALVAAVAGLIVYGLFFGTPASAQFPHACPNPHAPTAPCCGPADATIPAPTAPTNSSGPAPP